jgi:ankyrin repeat protein
LHYAVKAKNETMVKLLIEKFPDVNARSQQGETPLHIACKLGSFEIVQILT